MLIEMGNAAHRMALTRKDTEFQFSHEFDVAEMFLQSVRGSFAALPIPALPPALHISRLRAMETQVSS